jgi:hypothetical protein
MMENNMKRNIICHPIVFFVIFFVFSMILVIPAISYAGTTFTIIPNTSALGPFVDFSDIAKAESQVNQYPNDFISNNDTAIPNGFALANTLGYPNGKSIIQPLPHFEAGFAAGASIYKYDRYKDFSKTNPTIPGGGANGAIHFGTGITDRIDVTAKIMFNAGIYSPKKDVTQNNSIRNFQVSLKDTNIFSTGVKGRYNIVGEIPVVPYVFSFGGITAGVSLDYMYGKISTSGSYDYHDANNPVQFTISDDPITHNKVDRSVLTDTSVNGKASLKWSMLSVTPEIMTYIDLFYLFSIYTGPAITFTMGSVGIDANATGTIKNLAPIYSDNNIIELVAKDSTIATGVMKSNSTFNAPWILPTWKLGLELNLGPVKIQSEGAVLLTSPTKSFAGQVGVRVQF